MVSKIIRNISYGTKQIIQSLAESSQWQKSHCLPWSHYMRQHELRSALGRLPKLTSGC